MPSRKNHPKSKKSSEQIVQERQQEREERKKEVEYQIDLMTRIATALERGFEGKIRVFLYKRPNDLLTPMYDMLTLEIPGKGLFDLRLVPTSYRDFGSIFELLQPQQQLAPSLLPLRQKSNKGETQ